MVPNSAWSSKETTNRKSPLLERPGHLCNHLYELKITFKSLKSQVSRLRTELDDLREKHRERDRTREEELQSTKERLQLTQTEKVSGRRNALSVDGQLIQNSE